MKSKNKEKYWYNTEVECCVLCGVERKYRTRVYSKEKSGTIWRDTACHQHFM